MDIIRSWREQKVMLKWRYPILQDLDFVFEEGEREKMYSKLATKLNKTRSELEVLFADLQLH
ncbi:hypothetical protein [Marinoscillum luteum]|uniref:General stress protein CsbD n=1 Tax=Marinoscillum luteum TaxID=861051 RepID=A0ABW7N7N1_9BACT